MRYLIIGNLVCGTGGVMGWVLFSMDGNIAIPLTFNGLHLVVLITMLSLTAYVQPTETK
jgi:hypothetical protein